MKIQNQSTPQIQTNHTVNLKQIHHSSIAVCASNVSNTSNSQPKIITAEKTVHLKDVKQLNTKITNDIASIVSQLKASQSDDIFSRSGINLKNISATLSSLKNNIQSYQNKLDSSSYKHHASKQETVTKLDKLVENTEKQLQLAEGKSQRAQQQNNTIGLDHQQKVNERIIKRNDLSNNDY